MTGHELPTNLIPESKAVVRNITSAFDIDHDAQLSKTDYGHAMANMVRGIQAGADVFDKEQQRVHLRNSVKELLGKFGNKVIPFLGDELQSVLTQEEISKFNK